jgi:hypothetical protein
MATPIPPVPPQLHSPSGNFMALLYAYLLKLVAAIVAFFTGSVSASPTVASLEAQPGPSSNEPQVCIVEQYGSNYVFVPGSALTVDHITVLSETGGVAGQWIIQGGVPRMTTVQRNGLTDSPTPLLIWNTTTLQYEYWTGTAWLALCPLGGQWNPRLVSVGPVTAAPGDFILCTTTGGSIAVTGPATGAWGIAKLTPDEFVVSATTPAGNINGLATQTIAVQWGSYQILSYGTGAQIIASAP